MPLTDFLTQIADAIRIKDGTSDAIVATDFPQRILNIPSGSGSDLPSNIVTGTFTVPQDTSEDFYINHGLQHEPSFVFLFPDNVESLESYSLVGGFSSTDTKLITNKAGRILDKYNVCNLSINSTTISITAINQGYKLRSALTYRWYVWN